MSTFEKLFWESYTDKELQKIVSSPNYLTAYRSKALHELNNRTFNTKIK